MAIAYFGRFIDAKLEEVDQKGRYKYNIRQLLWDPKEADLERKVPISKQLQMKNLAKGLIGKYVPKRKS